MESIEHIANIADTKVEEGIEILGNYLRIPAISCDPDHFEDVRILANRICGDLQAIGLNHCEVIEVPGALPSVIADWLHAGEDKPTILIYGHLDIQPVKGEVWKSAPHEPVIRDGRLYARGSADDMGGWVSHMVALKAWFESADGPPCNIRLFIEGEEEIGSPNLERYMDAYPTAFEADVMILTDCENPSTEIPGLTVSLRGLIEVELTVEALGADVHSGLWGNMVPDVSTSLIKLISRLIDDDGRMTIGRVNVDEQWKQKTVNVPLDDEVITKGAHIIDGVRPLPVRDRTRAEWLWRQPTVTVVATTLPTVAEKKNALRSKASAILSIRVPPETAPESLFQQVSDVLTNDPVGGVKVTVAPGSVGGAGWLYTPKGEAFEAADRAYEKAWGHKLVQVGVGGSIPFVAMFGRRFGDLPLILNGVMDPMTTAHGPNESMHLGVFRKAVAANVYLLDELSRI